MVVQQDMNVQIRPHVVGIGWFNRVPGGPPLFYLRFRI